MYIGMFTEGERSWKNGFGINFQIFICEISNSYPSFNHPLKFRKKSKASFIQDAMEPSQIENFVLTCISPLLFEKVAGRVIFIIKGNTI